MYLLFFVTNLIVFLPLLTFADIGSEIHPSWLEKPKYALEEAHCTPDFCRCGAVDFIFKKPAEKPTEYLLVVAAKGLDPRWRIHTKEVRRLDQLPKEHRNYLSFLDKTEDSACGILNYQLYLKTHYPQASLFIVNNFKSKKQNVERLRAKCEVKKIPDKPYASSSCNSKEHEEKRVAEKEFNQARFLFDSFQNSIKPLKLSRAQNELELIARRKKAAEDRQKRLEKRGQDPEYQEKIKQAQIRKLKKQQRIKKYVYDQNKKNMENAKKQQNK